jgi:hypothetical protein
MFRHLGILASLQLMVGAFVGAAGCALFRLRRWAAVVLEGAAWCYLVYSVFFTVEFIAFALHSTPEHLRTAEQRTVLHSLVGGALFMLVFWGTPLVAAITSLRRPSNRALLR